MVIGAIEFWSLLVDGWHAILTYSLSRVNESFGVCQGDMLIYRICCIVSVQKVGDRIQNLALLLT